MMHMVLAGALALALPQQTDTTMSARPGGRLEVDNAQGSVTVRSWARNEVRIQATHSSRTKVEIDRTGNTISVDASGDHGPTDVRYMINVPRSFRVSIDGVGTDIDVQGTEGDINVSAVEGDVRISGVTGRVNAESVSGFVTIDGVHGDVSVSGTNQGMRLSNISGDVDAETVNGSISLLNIESSNVAAETVNGDIVLGTTIRNGGSYALSTTSGNISMSVPDGTNASIDISTYSGRLETALPLKMDKKKNGEYSFHIGTGSASIEIEAFSGNVRLVRPGELRDIPGTTKSRTKHK